ncbi:MAG: ATPase, T2SS/T4P/T4SS family [archaeon]
MATTKKYLYLNKEFNLILEKLEKKTLNIKDIEPYILKKANLDNEQIIKEIAKLNRQKKIGSPESIIQEKKHYGEFLTSEFSEYLVNYQIGYKQLTKLFESKDIEEIIINNLDKVFIIDRNQNKELTGVSFTDKEYDEFIDLLMNTVNKNFNKREFIDGALPEGSRLNIVSKNVCNFQAITIRKFTKKPLTIIDLINAGTLDSYTAAYLWTIIDGFKIRPANVFVCGGTGSGKTTFLNVLLDFINKNERIVLIEDTAEVNISDFDDSVSLLSDISNENSLFDITINTMRMRPDRIIIGEVRGKEVQGLFVAMDTGHNGCFATIHSNNSEDTVSKLLNKPMEISESNIILLDIIIILNKKIINEKLTRKISQITEITKMGNISLNHIYQDSGISSTTTNIMSSHFAEKLCEIANISKNQFKSIVEYRSRILEEICKNQPNITREKLKTVIHSPEFEYKTILNK